MKFKIIFTLNILLILILLVSTFTYVNNNAQRNEAAEITVVSENEWTAGESKQDVTLTIWSYKPSLENELESFQAAYPHIKVEFTNLQEEQRISERYLNALAEGTAPDILALTHAMLGSINSVDLIADLAQSNLDLEAYRETMGEYLWNIHQSLDGQRTIALPYEAHPFVLYYRHDILEKNGYPAEPEELGMFLEDPDNWLKLANDLRQKDQWIHQWQNDLLDVVVDGQFIFNRDIEYQRSSEFYQKLIDTTLKFKDLKADVSIWHMNGKEMLQNSQLVMVLLPSYGEFHMANWVPDQAGKWRATRLPLGIEAIANGSSLSLAVTAQSKNKASVEKLIEHLMNTSSVFNWNKSAPLNPFLGNQDSGDLYLELLREYSSNTMPTPLDANISDVWISSMRNSIHHNSSVDQALDDAFQDIMDITSISREQLQQFLQESPQ